MSKKAYLFQEAERLYVHEQNTPAEIAAKLGVSERTVHNWLKEGSWKEKRSQYLASRRAFHEELYEFARHLMRSIMNDMQGGQKVDTGRLYTLGRILPMILKVKEYEDLRKDLQKEASRTDLQEVIKLVEEEILGV